MPYFTILAHTENVYCKQQLCKLLMRMQKNVE